MTIPYFVFKLNLVSLPATQKRSGIASKRFFSKNSSRKKNLARVEKTFRKSWNSNCFRKQLFAIFKDYLLLVRLMDSESVSRSREESFFFERTPESEYLELQQKQQQDLFILRFKPVFGLSNLNDNENE